MIRLHFLVEGTTERTFVNEVLKPEIRAENLHFDKWLKKLEQLA